jgi:dTDP-4-amino-4,6-dideoxygalactose transaminase
MPFVPNYASNNAHMFYILAKDSKQRNEIIEFLKSLEIHAVFHYLSLHKSPFYEKKYEGADLKNTDFYSECLIRLSFFYELNQEMQELVINSLISYFDQ